MTPDILTAQQAMRFVPQFPQLFVTEDGAVLRYGVVELKPSYDKYGYLVLHIRLPGGVRKTPAVHRLVAMAWCDGYAPGLMVNHKDGVKDNNHASNLEWVTSAENNAHAVTNGLRRPKYSEETIAAIVSLRGGGVRMRVIAAATGASLGFVCDVINGRARKPPEQWKAGCHAK